MKKLAICCLLPLLLQSCYLTRRTVNEPLDHELLETVQIGMTAGQVVEKLGAPVEVVQLGRRTAYRYNYRIDKGTGSYWILVGFYNEDTRQDIAWFFFDESLKLTHKGSTFQAHRAGFHPIPWSDIYDEEDKRDDDEARGLK